MPIDFSKLSPELQATGYQESTWNPDMPAQGAYDTGAFQIIPELFHDRVSNDPGLAQYKSVLPQWPTVVDKQHPLPDASKKAISRALLADHDMQVNVARSYARSIVKSGINTPERFYYAWNHGLSAAQAAPDDAVNNDPNVQSFMRAYEGIKNGTLKLPAYTPPPKPLSSDQENDYKTIQQAWPGRGAQDYLKDAHDRGIDPVDAHSGLLFQAVHALNNGTDPNSIEAGLGRPVADIQNDYGAYKRAQKAKFDAMPATDEKGQPVDTTPDGFGQNALNGIESGLKGLTYAGSKTADALGPLMNLILGGGPSPTGLDQLDLDSQGLPQHAPLDNPAGRIAGAAPVQFWTGGLSRPLDPYTRAQSGAGQVPDTGSTAGNLISGLAGGLIGGAPAGFLPAGEEAVAQAPTLMQFLLKAFGGGVAGGMPFATLDPNQRARDQVASFGNQAGVNGLFGLGSGALGAGADAYFSPSLGDTVGGAFDSATKEFGNESAGKRFPGGYRGEPDVTTIGNGRQPIPSILDSTTRPVQIGFDPNTHEPIYGPPSDQPGPFRTASTTDRATQQFVDPNTLEPARAPGKEPALDADETYPQLSGNPNRDFPQGSEPGADQPADPNKLDSGIPSTNSRQAVHPATHSYSELYDALFQHAQGDQGDVAGPNTGGQDIPGKVVSSEDDSYEPQEPPKQLKAAPVVDEPTVAREISPGTGDMQEAQAERTERPVITKQGLMGDDNSYDSNVKAVQRYLDGLAGTKMPNGLPATVTPDVDLHSVNPPPEPGGAPGPSTLLDEAGFGKDKTPVQTDPNKPADIVEPSDSYLKMLRKFAKGESGSVNLSELGPKLKALGQAIRSKTEGWLDGSRDFQAAVNDFKLKASEAASDATEGIRGLPGGDLRDRWSKLYNKAIDAPAREFLKKAAELGVDRTTAEAHAGLLRSTGGAWSQGVNNIISRSKLVGYTTSGGSWASELATEVISPLLKGDLFDPSFGKTRVQVADWLKNYAKGKAVDVPVKGGTRNVAGLIDEIVKKGGLESHFLGDDSKAAVMRELAQADAKARGGVAAKNAAFWQKVDKVFGKGSGYYDHLLNMNRATSILNDVLNHGKSVDDAIYDTNKFYAHYDRPLGSIFNATEKSVVQRGFVNASLKFPKEMGRIALNAATHSPGSAMRLGALVAAGALTTGGGPDFIPRLQGVPQSEIDRFKKTHLTNFQRSLPFSLMVATGPGKTADDLRTFNFASIISPIAEAAGIGKGLKNDPGPDVWDKTKNVARDAISQYFQHGYVASLLGKERPGQLTIKGAGRQLIDQPSAIHAGEFLKTLPVPTGLARDLSIAGKPTMYMPHGDPMKDYLKAFGISDFGNEDDVVDRANEIKYGFKDPAKDINTIAKNPEITDPAVRKSMIQDKLDEIYRRGQDLQK